jgi:hypothetical protein
LAATVDYLMGEFSGGCTAADGCREQPLLAVILQEGMVLRKDKVEIGNSGLEWICTTLNDGWNRSLHWLKSARTTSLAFRHPDECPA